MSTKRYSKKIVIVGAGVAGINAATKLVDNGYPGELITIIDRGQDPYNRPYEEVMMGMLGAGGWSDGKLTYHTSIGGQLSKYCGEEKAMELMDQVIKNFTRFHPKPDQIFLSNPVEEPDFIKPHFGLRLFPVWHFGSNYLHDIAKAWYEFLLSKGIKFEWETEITHIDFKNNIISATSKEHWGLEGMYDKLIFAVGKSGIDFGKKLAEQYELETEPKAVQIGVRFEAPQKYFQKIIDVSYDFKLYQKPTDDISLRSFCTNNNAAYVAVEHTYGDVTYNGHAKKGEEFRNDMTNFGILMEIKGIENPFDWCRNAVSSIQAENTGLYYSPNNTRTPGISSEGELVSAVPISKEYYNAIKEYMDGYFDHIDTFIDNMNEIFEFGDDWGMYIPEVKYLSPEPLVNYTNLSLPNYPNVYFAGDALSARGITVSGAHGIYVVEDILKNK